MPDPEPPAAEPEQLLLRVVRGRPSDAELAALVAVVAGRRGSATTADSSLRTRTGDWIAYWRHAGQHGRR